MIQGFNPRTGSRPVSRWRRRPTPRSTRPWQPRPQRSRRGPGSAAEERARALATVAAALDARAGELVPLADEETALGEARLTGEVARTTGQLRLFAGVLRDGGYADAAASPPGGGIAEIRRINHPVGPVAVFAASNFPFAFSVAGGDTASASPPGARSWSRRMRGIRGPRC